jgi:LPS-assembly protein
MRFLLLAFALAFTPSAQLFGQAAQKNQGPVEITSEGGTRFEGGIAIADNNVEVIYGDAAIYCDHAEYNPDTHEVMARGHVRIYREGTAFTCDRAFYNLQTREFKATNFAGQRLPFQVIGENVVSTSDNRTMVWNGSLTTSDSSIPDYEIRARRVRIYSNDRVIFSNVTLYVHDIPVFWFPYLYQSLNDQFSYNLSPGYTSTWGAYLLTVITFPITDDIDATAHIDLRSSRGPALGFDVNYTYGDQDQITGRLRTYALYDTNPNVNETSLDRAPISPGRYRISYQSRAYITSDLVAQVNINKLSDPYFLQDYFPAEFQVDPEPDNFAELQKRGEAYTLTALTRFQANRFFETTERLPELIGEMARVPLFNGPVFYEGQTGLANLYRSFNGGSPNPSYGAYRIDSLHQFTLPETYFGFLSVVPRAAVRATYYNQTGTFIPSPDSGTLFTPPPTNAPPGTVQRKGPGFRFLYNLGLEASFKLSRSFEDVQSRWLGLDGLRHVIQPYTDFSYVNTPTLKPQSPINPITQPGDVLPFDRYIPGTEEPAIDFPQFNSVDSIDHWTIWRIGVRNRLQTRRDNATLNWIDIDSFIDVNFKNPYELGSYSDLVTRVRFNPVPWLSLTVNSQLPVLYRNGFTEVDTYLTWTVNPSLFISFGDAYLTHNPSIPDSDQISLQTYLRLNENWGVSAYGQYETFSGIWQLQRYQIHRDLSSWVATLSLQVQDNGGGKRSVTLSLALTLKALPQFGLPVNLLPSSAVQ